jgi:D-alanine transaminase
MESLACLNGELMPVGEARVPVDDRGFLFGDAVYEVIRLYEGSCWLEAEHWERLRRGVAALEFGGYDFERLARRMHRTISASGIREGTVYLHLTRGVSPRAHAFPKPEVPPTELIVVRPYDDAPAARRRVEGVAVLTHPDLRWKRCDIKSTNLLANVLAYEAARRAGCDEAILVDSEGRVTEGSHTSVLWARGGRLEGTPEGPGLLPGTTRHLVVRLAETIGIRYDDARVTREELVRADEVLLVGTATEVVPVVRVDSDPVADGTPGPVARRLQDAYREAVANWLAPQPH